LKRLLVFVLLITSPLLAENDKTKIESGNKEDRKHAVGFSGSSSSGVGISYMYDFFPGYRGKLTGIYLLYNSGDSGESSEIYSSVGLEFQKDIFYINSDNWAGDTMRAYFFLGGAYWYEEEKQYNEFDIYIGNETSEVYSAGIGLGLAYIYKERVVIDLTLSYQFRDTLGSDKKYIGLGAGAAVHLMF